MDKDVLINDFAIRCFRDVADQDYIAARLSFRSGLYPQFYWQSLQALEKYFKAIFLFNRIKATDIGHDLHKAIEYIDDLPFSIEMCERTEEFIKIVSNYGENRYFVTSYEVEGPKLSELDQAVWEIRRYCKLLDYEEKQLNGETINMLSYELDKIKESRKYLSKFRSFNGLLEKIIENRDHCSRNALTWQNLFFGKTLRKNVRTPTGFMTVNSPLYLNPEILDELIKYIFIPKNQANVIRNSIKNNSSE
jgi:HEPN domain-containing protein